MMMDVLQSYISDRPPNTIYSPSSKWISSGSAARGIRAGKERCCGCHWRKMEILTYRLFGPITQGRTATSTQRRENRIRLTRYGWAASRHINRRAICADIPGLLKTNNPVDVEKTRVANVYHEFEQSHMRLWVSPLPGKVFTTIVWLCRFRWVKKMTSTGMGLSSQLSLSI